MVPVDQKIGFILPFWRHFENDGQNKQKTGVLLNQNGKNSRVGPI